MTTVARTSTTAAKPASAQADSGEPEDQRYKQIDLALLRRMGQNLWPFRWRYIGGTLLGMAMVALEMLSPLFTQHIIDHASGQLEGQVPSVRHVVNVVLLWAVVLTAALIMQRFVILIMTGAGERVQFATRRAIFAQLQRLSMSFYDKTKLGRVISRCTSDVNAMREVNVWGIHHVTIWTLQMVIAAGFLISTDWRLFLAVAWIGPVLFVANRMYLRKSGNMWQQVREGFTRVSANLAENITGIRVVTAFNRQNANVGEFNRLQEENTANNMHAARINGVYQPLLQLLGFIGKVTILAYGAYLVVDGRISSVGKVVAAFLYWDYFMNPIIAFGNFYNQLMMSMAGAERVFALLDATPEVQDATDAKPIPPITGHVRFENVVFGYNADRPVLHGVSFEAQPGQTIALVGATGSGKSSIISLIARFYQSQSGRVLVDGHDIRYVTGESLHKQMGLVLQVNYLFTGTVLDNIKYARPEATLDDVIAAANALGTHDAIGLLKDGYHTEVGERGANMSLGQRQLICFTRAFLADPRIFMLDEATSAVDTTTEAIIQTSLERLLTGRTTFIVAHRLSTIMNADQILVIDAGHIVERGTHDELVDKGGKYAHLYKQFAAHA
ncbi:MAG TPA: ABC transporter ATP-binding protein [Tepidisphaeraceae bacterium]|jgi:ATP-binding cassette subfamily B protein|nr:ABC transporter ATP-binding protein [Tepidisphaeraceae bacterium]